MLLQNLDRSNHPIEILVNRGKKYCLRNQFCVKRLKLLKRRMQGIHASCSLNIKASDPHFIFKINRE